MKRNNGYLLVFLLLAGYSHNLTGQIVALNEAYTNLTANPPVFGDSAIRKECFDVIDRKCIAADAAINKDIKAFYNAMISSIEADIHLPSSGMAVVYQMYNHGYIIKMQDMVIGIDLVRGMAQWDMIPERVLNELDVVMVTHEHSDHYDQNILQVIKRNGGVIIIPSEMNFYGALELAPGDSVVIKGITFKAYYGLHGDTPMRIYEVYSPLGIKIVHTGDNQTSLTLPDIKDIDILLLNSWVNESDGAFSNVTGMYNCLQKLKPRLMIPGHCNEMSHVPSQRWAYDSVFSLMKMDIPSDVVVMAWGEKMIYKPNTVLPVYRTNCAPVVDGYWDTAWAFTPLVHMPGVLLEPSSDWFDLYGNFRVMWDPDNMYFFFSVKDDILRTDNPDKWLNDGIGLFFDGDNSKNDADAGYDENDTRMVFVENNGSWQADNSEFAFQETARGYNLEIRIPAKDLRFDPEPDLVIGFDAQVSDNDDGAQNSIIRWWSDSMDNWLNPGLFGTAKLVESTLSGVNPICYTPAPIQIDASSDDAWLGKELMIANNLILGEEYVYTPDDVNLLWNVLWDENYLYFWFEVTDDTLINDSGNDFYQDDCIEIWIDGDNSKGNMHDGVNDFCFQFRYHPAAVIESVKQAIGPSVDISKILQAPRLTDKGFILEVAIPLEILNIEPFDSTLFGIDFDYNDDDNSGERDTKFKAYAQFDNAWTDPRQWGTGMLCGSGKIPDNPSVVNRTGNFTESVRVSPNPFITRINVRIMPEEESEIFIDIVRISGELIHSEAIKVKAFNEVNVTCELNETGKGIYIVHVKTGTLLHSEKIVKL